jgi:16S rRNA (cytidine1402-2'-O)-methyltransferase
MAIDDTKFSLFIAATPIGNLGDITFRLAELLKRVDIIACEDTRKAQFLLSHLGIQPAGRLVSFFEHNEEQRLRQLVTELKSGSQVLMMSDAGMPSVSDPGYVLVRAAIDNDIAFTVLPGPSAVTTALVASGIEVDRFTFEGFLSRKAGERKEQLRRLLSEERTMVFFESGHRIKETIDAMLEVFGEERVIAICRELTKTYEEIFRGTLGEAFEYASGDVRGEITIVLAGASETSSAGDKEILEALGLLAEEGIDRKTAVSHVAIMLKVPKRQVFDLALKIQFSQAPNIDAQ